MTKNEFELLYIANLPKDIQRMEFIAVNARNAADALEKIDPTYFDKGPVPSSAIIDAGAFLGGFLAACLAPPRSASKSTPVKKTVRKRCPTPK